MKDDTLTSKECLEMMKNINSKARLLSYIIWNSAYKGQSLISLIHDNYAYPISIHHYDDMLDKGYKQKYPTLSSNPQEGAYFTYIDINLDDLPSDIEINYQYREEWWVNYYPRAAQPESFIIYFKYPFKDEPNEIEEEEIPPLESDDSDEEEYV